MAPSVELATGYLSLAISTRGMGRQVIGTFRGVERAAQQAGQASGNRFTAGMSSGLNRAQTLMRGTARAAGGVAVAIGGAAAAGALFGLKTAASMEQAKIGFTTMLGSGKKADKFLKDLANFAAKTPFEFPELQQAASSLIAAGINADKVIPIMRTLGDVTSGVGTGAEGVKRATIAIQQMNAAGRITAEDLNQLRDAGIPVYELLAKATGKSQAEVAKLASTGKLGRKELDQLMKALESGKGLERFTGLMKEQSKSLNGMLSTFKDTLGQGLAKALQPAIPIIKEWIGFATTLAEKALKPLPGFLKRVARGVHEFTSAFRTGMTEQDVATPFEKLALGARNLIKAIAPIARQVGPILLDVLKALGRAVLDAARDIAPLIRQLGPVIVPVIRFLAKLFINVLIPAAGMIRRAFIAIVKGAVETLGPAFRNIAGAIQAFVKVAMPIIRQIAAAFLKEWPKIKPVVMEIFRTIAGIVSDVMGAIARNIRFITKVIEFIWSRWGDKITAFTVSGFKDLLVIIKGFMKLIRGVINVVLGILTLDWRRAYKGIKQIAGGLKDVVVAIFRSWARLLKLIVGPLLNWIRDRWSSGVAAVKRIVGGWRDSVVKTTRDLSSKVRTAISDMFTKLRDRFETGVKKIGEAWDVIKDKAKKPVEFIITTVINKGLLEAIRVVSKLVNFKAGEDVKDIGLPKNWASGTSQVLPGYTPGRDVHRFYSATGGVLDLSGGEGIARPELVRMIGKRRWDELNLAAAHGKLTERYLGAFAQGTGFLGGLRPVPSGSTHRHSGYSWARWAGDLGAGMNTPVHAWKSGVIAAVRYLTTSYGRHIIENVQGSRVYYAHLARAVVRAGQSVNQGQVIGYSDSTGNSTGPHLHFEIRGGTAAISGGGPGGGGGIFAPAIDAAKYIKMVTDAIGKLKSIKDSPFGQMVASGAEMLADKIKAKITDLISTFNQAQAPVGRFGALGFTSTSGGTNRSIGHRMMLQRWPESQWPPLNSLWTRESGWRTTARNPSSGAYGIPQSLPASKMASAGSDWRTNPATQIKWGLGYIASRYGSPAGAWAHSRRTGWYAKGTRSAPPGWAVVGERGPELLRFSGGEQVVPNDHLRTTAGSPLIGEVHWHSEGTVRDDMEELGFQLRRINRGGVYARG